MNRPTSATLALAVITLALGLVTGPAPARAEEPDGRRAGRSCPDLFGDPPNQSPECPDVSGLVTVDGRYEFSGSDKYLGTREIQCAIDCLDGTPDQEHSATSRDPDGRWEPPPQIRGGVISFVPNLLYLAEGPIELPVRSLGPVIVQGNGATIEMRERYAPDEPMLAVLRRIAPPGSNNCDVDWLAGNTKNWLIEGLHFRIVKGKRKPAAFIAGLLFHGAYGLTIRNCSFTGGDAGVLLHSTVGTVIERSQFVNSRRHDIGLFDGHWCHDSGGTRIPCWGRCDRGGPKHFATTAVAPGGMGSHGARIRDTYHYTAEFDDLVNIVVKQAESVTIEGSYVDGRRPPTFVQRIHHGPGYFAMRDMHLFFVPTRHSGKTPLIDNRGNGLVVLDGLSFTLTPGPEWMYDTSEVGVGVTYTTIQNISTMPAWRSLKAIAKPGVQHYFSFVSVSDVISPADPQRWLDERNQPGAQPPPNLTVDSFTMDKLPQRRVTRDLSPGMIWSDGSGLWAVEDGEAKPVGPGLERRRR